MEAKHTKEPWILWPGRERKSAIVMTGVDGDPVTYEGIAEVPDPANAARIVACVNACQGIPDPSVVGELVNAILATQASEYTRHIHALAASIKNHTPAQDKPTQPCQSRAS